MNNNSPPEDWREQEAASLTVLYQAKAGGLTQGAFGKKHGIGTAGMVWQYLKGHRPLNLQAAIKFAEALKVDIDDFSPRLVEEVRLAAKYVHSGPVLAAEPDNETLSMLLKAAADRLAPAPASEPTDKPGNGSGKRQSAS